MVFATGTALPVAYLVCNALPGSEGKPAQLTHDDVVTRPGSSGFDDISVTGTPLVRNIVDSFLAEIPKNAVGKALRRELRAAAVEAFRQLGEVAGDAIAQAITPTFTRHRVSGESSHAHSVPAAFAALQQKAKAALKLI